MADNYHDAIYRMYESSDILYKSRQWLNANYLAGYILECYCKLILMISVMQGYRFSGNQQNIRAFSHRIGEMRTEIDLISLWGSAMSCYCLDIQNVCPNMLTNWNPNRRYEADSSILNTDAMATDIHKEAETLMDMLIKMEIDGVLE